MTDDDAELFIAMAESGSLAGGARRCGISPSLASRRLSRLETALGIRLVERSTRHLALTEAGTRVLAWARAAGDARVRLQEELRALQTEPAGSVRVAMDGWIASSYFPEILRRFSAEHPRIAVAIITSGHPPSALAEGCDVAIHTGPMPAEDLVGQRAYDYLRVLCAAPAYVAAHGLPATPRDLLAHRCISHLSARTWALRDGGGSVTSVTLEPSVESNSWLVVRTMALEGLGIARMGGPLVQADLEQGHLVRVLPDYDSVNPDGTAFGVWIIHASASPPHRVRLFSRFAASYLRRSAAIREVASTSLLDRIEGRPRTAEVRERS